ncbi:MAG: permease [Galbitalea sp.]
MRTSLLGIASSSCSYAASALARSLFRRGADFTSAMVFMFASTNLVIELGIVLWLLLGWQFALAEFVGGAIMIALFAVFAPRIFPAKQIAAARAKANGEVTESPETEAAETLEDELPLRQRLRSRSGWVAAAGYAISDLKMLRRELVIGYLVAGILAVAVPTSIYGVLFLQGHGFWTELENVVVGPFIAFISFVCSVGNVPLAAALFKGGFSFGGTVAFIFADLIAFPLVVVYARFYGRRLAARLFFAFWAVMSAAGLLVDLLFQLIRIPAPRRPVVIAPTRFEWNYTTYLDIAFLLVGRPPSTWSTETANGSPPRACTRPTTSADAGREGQRSCGREGAGNHLLLLLATSAATTSRQPRPLPQGGTRRKPRIRASGQLRSNSAPRELSAGRTQCREGRKIDTASRTA